MAKKEKVIKKKETIPEEDESHYSLSDDEILRYNDNDELDKNILETHMLMNRRFMADEDDFQKKLKKIKDLKVLHTEELNSEKPTQTIVDALADKIGEMIKKLE